MAGQRTLVSMCEKCDEVREFVLDAVDPGSASCPVCSATILLMKPVKAGRETSASSPR